MAMDNSQAIDFLGSLLGKRLRLHTSDTRMFIGEFKCTDNECNIILSQAYEYRPPTPKALNKATASESLQAPGASVKVDVTSRFLGLIVVPGKHILKIEAEER